MSFFRIARRAVRPAGAIAAVAVLGCSTDTLTVQTPDVIAPGALAGVNGALALRNGAVQDFTNVYSGTIDGFIVVTGNMGDEVVSVDTFDDRILPNQRSTSPNLPNMDTWYLNMHRARAGLTQAVLAWNAAKATQSAAQKDSLSEMYALRGYMETFFSEAYCSGVPFSAVVDGNEVYGEPQTTAQIQTRAAASFDTALTNATGTSYKYLAQVGKARVLLNAGQFAQAAAAVAGVPTNFQFRVFHSSATGRQNNGVWNATGVSNSRYNVVNNEGTNGYNYLQTPADPRMPWVASTRTGFDGVNRNLPTQMKYPGLNSAATLADGIEARLIELEARLRGGTQADRDAVFAGLNTLRATGLATAITPLPTAPTTQDAAVDMLFRERAYWMWLTGHRLGDMRRLIRQYGRSANTVFPVGPVVQRPGTTYGTDVNFPVPFNETNNPNFTGCLDRNA